MELKINLVRVSAFSKTMAGNLVIHFKTVPFGTFSSDFEGLLRYYNIKEIIKIPGFVMSLGRHGNLDDNLVKNILENFSDEEKEFYENCKKASILVRLLGRELNCYYGEYCNFFKEKKITDVSDDELIDIYRILKKKLQNIHLPGYEKKAKVMNEFIEFIDPGIKLIAEVE